MKRLFLWLNLVVAVGLTVGCFAYAIPVLTDRQVDPRSGLERMARASGHGAFLGGCVGLLFVWQSIALLRRKA